ncbi:MAG: hypothetical protein Q8P86_03915 [bacterium]|nr:hypothetical protein [bacterium]
MDLKREKIAMLFLRLGVAFSFTYAAISGFLNPIDWVGFFPAFMLDYIPGPTLLIIWGVIEIILAIWILFGRKIFIPSVIASLSLAGLIFWNWGALDIIFRDVTILMTTLALVVFSYRK